MHTVSLIFLTALQLTGENIYSQAGVWIQRTHLWKPAIVIDGVSFSHPQRWTLDVDKQRKSIIMGFKTSKTFIRSSINRCCRLLALCVNTLFHRDRFL